jgi:hypothetical protein
MRGPRGAPSLASPAQSRADTNEEVPNAEAVQSDGVADAYYVPRGQTPVH